MAEYDIVIIGAGPAGLSAGIYAGRAGRKTLILEKGVPGGRAALTERVVNYPGFSEISGKELTGNMKLHAEHFGVEIRRENVKRVEIDSDGVKHVMTRKNEYTAETVIAATGTSPRRLGIPGEERLAGRGVAYCAACDAEFFKGCTVAVIGSGDQAVEESELIARYADRVIIIVIHDEGQLDCNALAAQAAFQNPKIEFVWNSAVAEIHGETSVTGVTLRNMHDNTEELLKCDGVFLFVGVIPNSSCISGLLGQNSWISANERMETNVSGIFVAGDVRDKPIRQIASAVSDGAVAASMADAYLTQRELYHTLIRNSYSEEIKLLFWSSLSGIHIVPDGASHMEIDIDKNSYISAFFGIDMRWFTNGRLNASLKDGKLKFL